MARIEIREKYLEEIRKNLQIYPICGILGPRQVGKTTLAEHYAKKFFPADAHFIDLENPLDLARLENPMLTLMSISERLIVIDEVQRMPDLFPILRVLADRTRGLAGGGLEGKSFLILGSVSPKLKDKSSESLTGRIGYVELNPFSLTEVNNSARLFHRGGFPQSYLAKSDKESYKWRADYITSFLERDIPKLGYKIPPELLRRFWSMLAFYHGQVFNGFEMSRSLMVSPKVVKKCLDVLVSTFMIRVLQPRHENIKKRQIKSPKIYYRDSGILNVLAEIENASQLYKYAKLGAFWEGFGLEEIIRLFNVPKENCYFWATHADAELDLLILRENKKLGFEFKHSDAPKISKSMHIALEDIKLDHLALIYPGDLIFPLSDKITAYGLETIISGEFQEKYRFSHLIG